MTIHKFSDFQQRERQLDVDKGSAQVVDIALARMRSGAVVKEERRSKGKFVAVVAAIVVTLTVFAGHDFVFQSPDTVAGEDGTISVSLDQHISGHYFSKGMINDQPVKFLLDTGATDVAIPESVAKRLGLVYGQKIFIKTANGTSTAYDTRIRTLSLGGIVQHDIQASIATGMEGDQILLGMSFLRHLDFVQRDGVLTLSMQ